MYPTLSLLSEPMITATIARVAVGSFLIVAILSVPSRLHAQAPSASTKPTLYERLGGYDAIAGFVDLAFPRVAMHPDLAHFFRGHSIDSQFRQRQLIVDALCHATGGPCLYIGRPMKPVHDGLGITDEHWQTFLGIITAAMDEKQFRRADKEAFLAIFEERFRPDVVEPEQQP